MPIHCLKNSHPVDEDDPSLQDVFDDLQGNILNGHGRDHAVHLLVRFNLNRANANNDERVQAFRRWVASFAATRVTSARRQVEGSKQFKRDGTDAGVFATLSLSSAGYAALEVPKEIRPRLPNLDDGKKFVPYSGIAMRDRQEELLDPKVEHWEEGYQKLIDALVVLAADKPDELGPYEGEVRARLKDLGALIVAVERGKNITRERVPVEHFGYADGVSQPAFLRTQIEREPRQVGTRRWDPSAPLDLVLVPDPGGDPGVSFGSYLVFRKLEQNVRGFRTAERKLASALGVTPELAGAMAVGRFKDGRPLVLPHGAGGRSHGEQAGPANDFNYRDDPKGLACPFHAHIRKSNPRLESVPKFAKDDATERAHRIARRGIPYGGELNDSEDLEELPTGGVGLLFMCYQANLFNQFEFMQRFWCNNRKFVRSGEGPGGYDVTGLDPVVGQKIAGQVDAALKDGAEAEAPRNWPKGRGEPTIKISAQDVDFTGFVTLKGGEYFFTPSLTFLKKLPSMKTS